MASDPVTPAADDAATEAASAPRPAAASADGQKQEAVASLRRLVGSVRRLIDRVVALDAPPDALARVSESLDALTEALGPWHGERPIPNWALSFDPKNLNAILPWSPLSGRLNPIAPPIDLSIEGDTVVGRVTLGRAYEGPPGCAHGAVVAGAFDQVLALVNVVTGNPAMTGTLTIKYRRPTPLYRELRFVARTDRVEGRKVYASATLHAGETLVAESEALFILVAGMPAVP